ncbi:MAG: hypothetical protein HUU35_14850, partial [Armatimonadetes bacterium]|nr:hypothetical protein [Armatimonadota bacterium]
SGHGPLLLTHEGEALREAQLLTVRGGSAAGSIALTEADIPQTTVVATQVRDKQLQTAELDLGVELRPKVLEVTVTPSVATATPRQGVTFTITATRGGQPVDAEVALAVVDESIFAMAEEHPEEAVLAFYGQRWNRVMTAFSAEPYYYTGTKGGSGRIRREFPDTAGWYPSLRTGPDGVVMVGLQLPDSLTTWRATARALTKETQVGQQVEKVVTTKDLIVRLQAPRFFTQLDESTVSMIVTNKTSNQQQVALNLQAEGLKLVGDPAAAVVVAPNGQARVDRVVRAREAGEATMTVTARGPDDSDGLKLKFEVIPHGAEKFDTATGRVAADGKAAFTLDLPAARREDATRLKVTVSPSLVTSLLDALPYLVEYPYGCVEQTTSRFLPAVMVARTLEYTGKPQAGGKPAQVPAWWESRGLDALPDMVSTGIKKLSSMQNGDGGFGWFGGMRSDVWMSAYVTYGLLQARLADFAVDQEVLTRAVRFLYGNLHLLKGQHDSTAYVAWVLTEAQANKLAQPDAAQRKEIEDAFQRVYANRDQLNDYTRALLILGLVNRGERDKAEVAWRNLQAHRIETEHGVHWGKDRWGWRWSEDQVETTAFSLLAALAMEPQGDLALKAVNWLVLNRTGNHWYSTKDTAAAIFALARYADLHDELRATYSAKLTVNGREVKGWEVTPQNALSLDGEVEIDPALLQSGENRLELSREGSGSLYYAALLEYYTKEDPITAASSYISATRRYFRVTDYTDPQDNSRKTRRTELKSGESIASGEQLEVEVTIDAENDFSYICLADPKPAGCEPVDQTSGGTWGGAWMYRELHDTEVTFFVDHLPQGKTTLTYRLRAETPGTFRALPHRGFSMYRPDVRALSDEATVRVAERVAS